MSKLYDVPVGFVTPPPILRLHIAFLRSPKGGCCSISDDLSCSFKLVVALFRCHGDGLKDFDHFEAIRPYQFMENEVHLHAENFLCTVMNPTSDMPNVLP